MLPIAFPSVARAIHVTYCFKVIWECEGNWNNFLEPGSSHDSHKNKILFNCNKNEQWQRG